MSSHQDPSEQQSKSLPAWLPVAIIGGVIAVIIAIAVTGGGGGESDHAGDVSPTATHPAQTNSVVVSGDGLAPRGDGSDDAVGTTAPEITGFDFTGRAVSFTNGSPRAVLLLAHWCPHCQAEVNSLTAYLAGNDLPGGVEVQTISTWVNADRNNFPPSKWLTDVSWPFAVLVDDEVFTAANSLGLSGTPMWVFIDADGVVVERTGALEPQDLAARLTVLAG